MSVAIAAQGQVVVAAQKELSAELVLTAATTYADIAFANYSDAASDAEELHTTLQTFIGTPTVKHLTEAKQSWRRARQSYLQTEAFRFYAGPIDDERALEPLINGWPLDEFYIDYVEGAPNSGIIQDEALYPEITPALLQRHNEKAGETAITCGFHAIEFLLWGQDLSPNGPGNRPVTDYTTAKHAARRASYLQSCSQLLTAHLTIIRDEWNPEIPNNYRDRFLTKDPRRSLWFAVYGLMTFSGKELAGERLLVAWDTQAQEDEHSCFSDTTLDDLRFDVQGLLNVLIGQYSSARGRSVSGIGIQKVLTELDKEATQELTEAVKATPSLIKKIPAPFDQAILGNDSSPGRQAILRCVEQLEQISGQLAQFEQLLIALIRSNPMP